MIHIALAAGSLPFVVILLLKIRAQREQQKRARDMQVSADRWMRYGAQR